MINVGKQPLRDQKRTFVPALDDAARAQLEVEGVAAITGGVELGPVEQCAGVMDGDIGAVQGLGAATIKPV